MAKVSDLNRMPHEMRSGEICCLTIAVVVAISHVRNDDDLVEKLTLHSVRPGELWRVQVGDGIREVRVIASAAVGGWWHCLDLETDLVFSARGEWFRSKQEPPPERDATSGP